MFSGAIKAGASGQGGGFYPFEIDQSLRFEDGDSAYLSRTPASVSNRKTMTFSFWFKRGNFGATQKVFSAGVNSSNHATVDLRADGRLQVFSNTSGVQDISIVFDPIVFRDVSAWYHFTVIIDTTSSTQTDRVQLYVNGTRHTGISSTGGENIWPDQNDDSQFNTTVEHNIGRRFYSANAYYDGYLADVNFIDGTAYTADSFGQLKSGIWIPKEVYLDDNLSWTEKILFVEIDSLDNKDGCFASNNYFSEFVGISSTSVSTCISKLVRLGYVENLGFDGRVRILKSLMNFQKPVFKKSKSSIKKKPKGVNEKSKGSKQKGACRP